MDRLVSVTMKEYAIRCYIADMSTTVETMTTIHDATPSAAAAAGRTLVATAILGAMLKEESHIVNSVLRTSGEIGKITAVSNSKCQVKCEIANPYTSVALNDVGKIDVKRVVGSGTLTILKDIGLKMPYVGVIDLTSGEIAEDFAYYFAKSEQIPSVVSLGVFVRTDLHVQAAGGFVIQLMPGCDGKAIEYLEKKAAELPAMSKMLMDGMSLDSIRKAIFDDLGESSIVSEKFPEYYCDCNRDKIAKVLLALGKDELTDIRNTGETIEIVCHFCNTKYYFEIGDIEQLLESNS